RDAHLHGHGHTVHLNHRLAVHVPPQTARAELPLSGHHRHSTNQHGHRLGLGGELLTGHRAHGTLCIGHGRLSLKPAIHGLNTLHQATRMAHNAAPTLPGAAVRVTPSAPTPYSASLHPRSP